VSPFYSYAATGILSGTAPDTRHLTILAAIASFATAFACWRHRQRDL
jgi:hypothetical protein